MVAIAGVVLAALVGGGALLFAGGSNALARIDTDSAGLIDAKTNAIKTQVAVGAGPGPIAVGAGSIWVANHHGIGRRPGVPVASNGCYGRKTAPPSLD